MKYLVFLMIAGLQLGSVAQAQSPIKYSCEIQQMNFVDGKFVTKTYAKNIMDLSNSGSLTVEMPRTPNDPKKMQVILEVGNSYDQSKVHVGFTAIDKRNSDNPADWRFAFQIETEFNYGTPFISLQSSNSVYLAEFSCKLLTK